MSLLKTVSLENADGVVKDIYKDIDSSIGMVPNILQLFSVNTKMLKALWSNTKEIMDMEEDDKKLHIILRLYTSNENSCKYCIGIYSSMLINMFGLSSDEVLSIKEDPSTAPLSDKNKKLLLFTLSALKNPQDVNSDSLKELEDIGITQKEIFDAVHNASYIAVVNTLSSVFKVEIDF